MGSEFFLCSPAVEVSCPGPGELLARVFFCNAENSGRYGFNRGVRFAAVQPLPNSLPQV